MKKKKYSVYVEKADGIFDINGKKYEMLMDYSYNPIHIWAYSKLDAIRKIVDIRDSILHRQLFKKCVAVEGNR